MATQICDDGESEISSVVESEIAFGELESVIFVDVVVKECVDAAWVILDVLTKSGACGPSIAHPAAGGQVGEICWLSLWRREAAKGKYDGLTQAWR